MRACLFALILTAFSTAAWAEYVPQPGPDWKLVWADEFNGPSLNTNDWNFDMGFGDLPEKNIRGWGVGGLQDYTDSSSNVFVSNGHLFLRSVFLGGDRDKRNYTSGKIHTRGKHSFQYGLIAARIRMPVGQGTFPAFWMLGTNFQFPSNPDWPFCGEIDIVETFDGGYTANAASHWYDEIQKTAPGKSASVSMETRLPGHKPFSGDFHVYELEWSQKNLHWKIDGRTVLRQAIGISVTSELRQPMFLILNNGVGSWFDRVGYPDGTTSFPQDMIVDWVRVYQR